MSYFAYPWILLALLPGLLLIWYFMFIKKQPGIVIACLPRQMEPRSVFSLNTPLFSGIFMSLALLFLITALARPRLGDEKLLLRQKGIDMIMAIDLSGSMQAYDLPDNITNRRDLNEALESGKLQNRLESAKLALTDFVQKRPNDRIGLIGFADFAYNLSPPTLDHAQLLGSLKLLQPEMIGNATGLASPIASAVKRLDKSSAPRRVLVLFTDGVNTANHRLTPLETAQLAKEKNVTIYTVGIGGNRSFAISNGMLMNYNNEFDEKTLQEIASITGGKYFRAADQDALNTVMQEINQLEKTNFEQPRYMVYKEYAPLLAALALICIVLALICESTFERSVP